MSYENNVVIFTEIVVNSLFTGGAGVPWGYPGYISSG